MGIKCRSGGDCTGDDCVEAGDCYGDECESAGTCTGPKYISGGKCVGKKCTKGGGCKGSSCNKGGGCEGNAKCIDGDCQGPFCHMPGFGGGLGGGGLGKPPPCNTPNCKPPAPPPCDGCPPPPPPPQGDNVGEGDEGEEEEEEEEEEEDSCSLPNVDVPDANGNTVSGQTGHSSNEGGNLGNGGVNGSGTGCKDRNGVVYDCNGEPPEEPDYGSGGGSGGTGGGVGGGSPTSCAFGTPIPTSQCVLVGGAVQTCVRATVCPTPTSCISLTTTSSCINANGQAPTCLSATLCVPKPTGQPTFDITNAASCTASSTCVSTSISASCPPGGRMLLPAKLESPSAAVARARGLPGSPRELPAMTITNGPERTAAPAVVVRAPADSLAVVAPRRELENWVPPAGLLSAPPARRNELTGLPAAHVSNETIVVQLPIDGPGNLNETGAIASMSPSVRTSIKAALIYSLFGAGPLADDCKYFAVCAQCDAPPKPAEPPKPPADCIQVEVEFTYTLFSAGVTTQVWVNGKSTCIINDICGIDESQNVCGETGTLTNDCGNGLLQWRSNFARYYPKKNDLSVSYPITLEGLGSLGRICGKSGYLS